MVSEGKLSWPQLALYCDSHLISTSYCSTKRGYCFNQPLNMFYVDSVGCNDFQTYWRSLFYYTPYTTEWHHCPCAFLRAVESRSSIGAAPNVLCPQKPLTMPLITSQLNDPRKAGQAFGSGCFPLRNSKPDRTEKTELTDMYCTWTASSIGVPHGLHCVLSLVTMFREVVGHIY